ncbi:MAG: SDR family oxidoreductase, partial [Porticoccaceae bacterium]|nr:SDR family oxidoreductase [Porticoccaceae bacterium]
MRSQNQSQGRLHGKLALITGAARGVGYATAERFCEEGAEVLLADVNVAQGEAAAAQLGARFVSLNVAEEADWQRIAALISDDYGKLDILVNNAAILRASDVLQESLPVSYTHLA